MQTCDLHISELKHSPLLPQAIAELNAFWKEEQMRCSKFPEEMDESTKAEFIEGNIILHSPAKELYNAAVQAMARLIGAFVDRHDLGIVRLEKAMLHLRRNNFEPDLAFWSNEKAKNITPDTMLYPAPDWVCEVLSPATAKTDRGIKLVDYALHGISEYWIVDPDKQQLEQYLLKETTYELSLKSKTGIIESKALTGLNLKIEAIFNKEERLALLLQQFLNNLS